MTTRKNAPEVSPTTWIQRMARGDPAAREEICRRYGKKVEKIVRAYLDSVLRRRMDTHDLTQEALLEIVLGAK